MDQNVAETAVAARDTTGQKKGSSKEASNAKPSSKDLKTRGTE